jgi:geranylgeranyl pyrophosphate synthase
MPSSETQFEIYITERRNRLETQLQTTLNLKPDSRLLEAMRYSVLGIGKRLRPLLVYATGEAFGATIDALDIPATAVELIHQFSLIHDDLPAMDDDTYRRGRLTCHKKFGEAVAILAGDALQTLAFETLSQPNTLLSPEQQTQSIHILAKAVGALGLCYGQTLDIDGTTPLSEPLLREISRQKTGTFFVACLQLGAIAARKADKDTLKQLAQYGYNIGLAFQLQDDLFDIEKDNEKSSFPKNFAILAGEEKTRTHAIQLYQEAINQLETMQLERSMLMPLTKFMLKRLY